MDKYKLYIFLHLLAGHLQINLYDPGYCAHEGPFWEVPIVITDDGFTVRFQKGPIMDASPAVKLK